MRFCLISADRVVEILNESAAHTEDLKEQLAVATDIANEAFRRMAECEDEARKWRERAYKAEFELERVEVSTRQKIVSYLRSEAEAQYIDPEGQAHLLTAAAEIETGLP